MNCRSPRLLSLSKYNILKNSKRKNQATVLRNKWASVIGLEVHAQIASNSKLFSGAAIDFTSPVNSNVSLFDAAIPGTLPVLNKRCVEAGVKTALALSCQLNAVSYFDRKHYFYADLPAGYQITQQRLPLANFGNVCFPVYTPGIHKSPYMKTVTIKQIQLEQDSGKSLHDEANSYSLVDLNRAGIPLMEIVFEPDLTDGEEAAALIKELSLILQRLGTCSCKMEEGALRVDANISVNRKGEPLGVRSEIKNIGSIRGVASAIKYEIERQILLLESGGTVINETRSWDAQNKKTIAMRDKESVQDYRYMPEPNLPPLHLNMGQCPDISNTTVNVKQLKDTLPELPEDTRRNLCEQHRLTTNDAIILVNNDVLLKLFQEITKTKNIDPKRTVNILVNDLLTIVHKHKLDLDSLKISAEHMTELINLIQTKTINFQIARKLLEEIVNGNAQPPIEVMNINKWTLISDETELKQLCEKVIEENPKLVEQYLRGKTKVFKALMGTLVAQSEGRTNMTLVTTILQNMLDNMKNK